MRRNKAASLVAAGATAAGTPKRRDAMRWERGLAVTLLLALGTVDANAQN